MELDLVILEWNWLPTSGLDWRESTSPCENRTGVSLSVRSVLVGKRRNSTGWKLTLSKPEM
jgi:hypothetical protein